MKRSAFLIIGGILFLVLILAGVVYLVGSNQFFKKGSKCAVDNDCVVFGQSGDCNCGCYLQGNVPAFSEGECSCLAPASCRCVNGKCEGVFEEGEVTNFEKCLSEGNQVLDSYPRECRTEGGKSFFEDEKLCLGMSLDEAKGIAAQSECGDKFIDVYVCNPGTESWWIDLDMEEDMEKEGCYPACVVNIETKTAQINWRCTGLIVPEEE